MTDGQEPAYRILTGYIVPDDLERQVSAYIEQGYEPVGGLHVLPPTREDGSRFFCQAVYRRRPVTVKFNEPAPLNVEAVSREIARQIDLKSRKRKPHEIRGE